MNIKQTKKILTNKKNIFSFTFIFYKKVKIIFLNNYFSYLFN